VLHTLCDVVSKNGNMMLSVPIRGDGMIDAKEREIVEAIGAWMRTYGDAIYGTRPWRIHAEGSTASSGGSFSEGGQDSTYTSRDIRYVRKGEAVHALVLGWPEDDVVRLTLLSSANTVGRGSIDRVTFPNSAALPFRRTSDALEVRVPPAFRNPIGMALIIDGRGLTE
jgi:alpha-L-fucosidase